MLKDITARMDSICAMTRSELIDHLISSLRTELEDKTTPIEYLRKTAKDHALINIRVKYENK